MSETFAILAGFLDKFSGEVEGRELAEPAPEEKNRLKQLARGELADGSQTELLSLLSRNPQWIAWLAEEVKTLRGRNA